MKLMFATVFSRDAKLLILDEATNGLDPVVREELMGNFRNILKMVKEAFCFQHMC